MLRTFSMLAIAGVSAAAPGLDVHAVRSGETLEGIARRYGVSTVELARHNDLADPNRITAGARLTIPAATPAPAGRRTAAAPAARPASAPGVAPRGAVRIPAARAKLAPLFERYAKEAGIPVDLAKAVAWQESGWQATITSSTGAIGVMQLMPDTTVFVSKVLLGRKTLLDPRDPASNIRMGTRFLRYLLDRNGGDVTSALGSYYQGLRSVRERGMFAETRAFAANVIALRRRF